MDQLTQDFKIQPCIKTLVKQLITITTDDQPEEQKDKGEKYKNEEAVEKEKPYVPPPPYKPHIPYPQRLVKSKNEGQFKKFVELLKQLNITIPFT